MATYLSVVVPAKDEEQNVELLYQKILSTIRKTRQTYEIIFVDDGSTDKTYERLTQITKKDKNVRVIRLRGNFGKSIALSAGFEKALGEIIITLDADLQDNPLEIPRFIEKLNQGYDLVTGWKKRRHDPITKVLPSRILNNILIPILTGVKLHDNNCGFKAYKKEVVKNLCLYGELYRYIPIFATKENFKVCEIEVEHREREHGKSKFGWERNLKGFLDLITVTFLTGYLTRPGHFFGGLGMISSFIGLTIGAYISFLRITTGTIQYRYPLLFLSILLIIVGVQMITTGLVAEMIVSFNQSKSDTEKYIKDTI